ncbi:hypothetical protein D3C73_1253640 [compost metagenome]
METNKEAAPRTTATIERYNGVLEVLELCSSAVGAPPAGTLCPWLSVPVPVGLVLTVVTDAGLSAPAAPVHSTTAPSLYV